MKAALLGFFVVLATAGALCGPGVDYETQSVSLTFVPTDTTQPNTIKVCGDMTIEPHETFRVVLSNPANASIGTGTGTGTINNDDHYTFTGFFEPVENLPVLNGVNAGRITSAMGVDLPALLARHPPGIDGNNRAL